MKKIVFEFSLAFFFSSAVLYGQAPDYTLAKTGLSSTDPAKGSLPFQWIASNRTAHNENFYIYDIIPAGFEVETIHGEDSNVSSLLIKPSLPVSGPETLLIGPFPISAGSSVTFFVSETQKGAPPKVKGKTVVGETFALVPQTQLSKKTNQVLASTINSSSHGLAQSTTAAPNISRDDQPINFLVNLNSPAQIDLALFAVTGERVYGAQAQGIAGMNTLTWKLKNASGQSVASGLYIYFLKISDGGMEQTKTGRLVILH